MGNSMPKVPMQIYKGERNKTYIVLPLNKTWKENDYISEANKLLKVKSIELKAKDGYVLDGKDLYWHVKDMPDDLRGSKVTPVKVVYKK